jgi:glycosyltransferase involved in cell wall biosynthesis
MSVAVTAIVPCMTLGDRPFVREAVQSIRDQTEPCEIIVVVEESNDWIETTLAGIPNIRIMRIPFSPPGPTRNAAVAEARTEFVAFLDADDVWLPNKTAVQLEFLRKRKADFVGVDHTLMREDGTVFAYGTAKYIPMPSSWMVRRDFMLRFPFRDKFGGKSTDDAMWWRDTEKKTERHRIAEHLVKYRVRTVSVSSEHWSKQKKLRFANMSRVPLARPLLLVGSYVVHFINRRTHYVPFVDRRSH